jgi:putative ABC transport system ATP-binding protein
VEPGLIAEGLAVRPRGGPVLLRDLDLAVPPGASVALAGPSGLGKSTVLRSLAALEPLEAGRLLLDGRSPEELGVPRWRRRVGWLAQVPRFLGLPTVAEELARPARYASAEGPSPSFEAGLDALGLPRRCLASSAEALSVGERQRIALLRALAVGPAVLLVDEPTSALDPESTARIEAHLEAARVAGLGLLWVSHDPAQRERVAERVVDLLPYRVSGDA